jgi:hypothetical protein
VVALLGLAAPLSLQAAQAAPESPRQATIASSPTERQRPQARPPAHGVLSGLDDHWESDIVQDDKIDGARSGIVGTFLAWTRSDMSLAQESRMLIQYAGWATSRGAIPMVDLHPPSGVTLKSIAAGSQDATLAVYAKALHKWNRPFLYRLFPEMNISRQPYAPGWNGNTPAEFIAAWRHIYRLFRHYGATRVKFIWNPDKYFKSEKVSFKHLWPGRNYVNWVRVDVFDFNNRDHGIYNNAQVATAPSVKLIRKFTKKPLMLPELGVSNLYSKKSSWIATSLKGLAALGVRAVVWFNEVSPSGEDTVNWRLDSSKPVLRASRHMFEGATSVWPGHNHGSLSHDRDLINAGHW